MANDAVVNVLFWIGAQAKRGTLRRMSGGRSISDKQGLHTTVFPSPTTFLRPAKRNACDYRNRHHSLERPERAVDDVSVVVVRLLDNMRRDLLSMCGGLAHNLAANATVRSHPLIGDG